MTSKDNRLIDTAVNIVVYQSATHGEHAGKLSVLLVTSYGEVYGLGMNTLITNAVFNKDFPMQEGNSAFFSSWVKVDMLCRLRINKIIVGLGYGAAVTKDYELLTWGTGATTYLPEDGIEMMELFHPSVQCRSCNTNCADYGRRIGNIWLSYCKEQQTLVSHSLASPLPKNVQVRRVGNRRYGALACSVCTKDCDIQVMENHSFNFCNNCTVLWDLDDNARPMTITSAPVGSFLQKLEYPGMIYDVTGGPWGLWVLADSSHILFSGFFVPPDTPNIPTWWNQALSLPSPNLPGTIVSVHSSKSDVFVITDSGALFKRVVSGNQRSDKVMHVLTSIPLEMEVKKLCCGRYASLCLLNDGTLWVIYSAEDRQMNTAEKIYGKTGIDGCMDISGISFADFFYVQTNHQGCLRKKHPLTGNLIEVMMGDVDCKSFLWRFSDHCRVSKDGNISYSPSAAAHIIDQQSRMVAVPGQSQKRNEEIDMENASAEGLTEGDREVATNTGLGLSVGVTKWSSWGSRLRRVVAVGWQCLAELSNRTYSIIRGRAKVKRPELLLTTPLVLQTALPAGLPSFQSSLYGQERFSDLTLILSDEDFPVHRIVLCSMSKFWLDKLTGSNADDEYMDMTAHNPRAYRCLLQHYYQIEPNNLNTEDFLDLLILATAYGESHIAREVEVKIKSKVDNDCVAKVMDVAQKNSLRCLLEYCESFVKGNPAPSQLPIPAVEMPTTSPYYNPAQPENPSTH